MTQTRDICKVPLSMENKTPPYGRLPAGIEESDLHAAIQRSGYPFQATVAERIEDALNEGGSLLLQEEWAYPDSETGQIRSIDIFVEYNPPREDDKGKGPASPVLDILVECKQSELPYVFFLRASAPEPSYSFPAIIGIAHSSIKFYDMEMMEPIGPMEISMSMQDCLHMWDFPFFGEDCFFCVSMTRTARKSASLELTGTEASQSIVFPLTKALMHLNQACQPADSKSGSGLRIVICLAVLKAPMYGVAYQEGRQIVEPLPWIRVFQIQPSAELDDLDGDTIGNVLYFDVVHETFLEDYLRLLHDGFLGVAERVFENEKVILSGKALWGSDEGDDEETSVYRPMIPLPENFDHPASPIKGSVRRMSTKLRFSFPKVNITQE